MCLTVLLMGLASLALAALGCEEGLSRVVDYCPEYLRRGSVLIRIYHQKWLKLAAVSVEAQSRWYVWREVLR